MLICIIFLCLKPTHQQSNCPFQINTSSSLTSNGDFELPKL